LVRAADYVLFKGWVPCTERNYALTIIAILFTGCLVALIRGIRVQIEAGWIAAEAAARAAAPKQPPHIEAGGSGGGGGGPAGGGGWGVWRQALPRSVGELWRNCVRAAFTLVTMTLDYSLMLISMTFNVGIFLAVIFGFALGSLLFGHMARPLGPARPLPGAVDSEPEPEDHPIPTGGGCCCDET
jgi:copper transporter 1